MNGVIYRKATAEDCDDIALLHAKSWQENYRGIYSDHYLDHEVISERKEYWKNTFEKISPSMNITVADCKKELVGFSCTYSFYQDRNEHYLDNLHVRGDLRGNGIGAQLLSKSAEWAYSIDNQCLFYLLVYETNVRAIKFYKRHGANITGPSPHVNYDGSIAPIMRCTWTGMPLA